MNIAMYTHTHTHTHTHIYMYSLSQYLRAPKTLVNMDTKRIFCSNIQSLIPIPARASKTFIIS